MKNRPQASAHPGTVIELYFLDWNGVEQCSVTHSSMVAAEYLGRAEHNRLALERYMRAISCELLSARVVIEGGDSLELEAQPPVAHQRPRLSLVRSDPARRGIFGTEP